MVATGGDGADQVVASLLQQGLVGDRTGGDDTHHLAFDGTFAGGRIADLFANGHRLPQTDQSRQVALHRMVRHTGHGDRFPRRGTAGGEGDV